MALKIIKHGSKEYSQMVDLRFQILRKPLGLTFTPEELAAEKEDFFFVKEQDIQIEFTRNDKKEVTGFILHQGGASVPCKKIK